jgi:hypothetical protein
MAVEAGHGGNGDRPPLLKHHAVLDHVQFEGTTVGPRLREGTEGAIERRQYFPRYRRQAFAFLRRLGFFIGQPRRRAHQPALEPMSPFAAGTINPQMCGEAGTIDTRLQRAEII